MTQRNNSWAITVVRWTTDTLYTVVRPRVSVAELLGMLIIALSGPRYWLWTVALVFAYLCVMRAVYGAVRQLHTRVHT